MAVEMSKSDDEEKQIVTVSPSAEEDSDVPPHIAARRTIRYFDEDVENQRNTRSQTGNLDQSFGIPLTRQDSTYSIHSLRTIRTGGRSIDAALALPVTYRTVSFNISTSQERGAAETKQAKDKASADLAELDWHTVDHVEIFKRLTTSPDTGLNATQVKEKFARHGRNVPSPPKSQLPQKIFGYFFGGFGSILLGGSILVFISWKPLGNPPAVANLALAIVLAAVFVVQAAFNAWQDFSSSRVMSSITGMLPEDCLVLRDGNKQTVQAQDVVPGDIMYFKAGSKAPADIRFLEVSSDAKFDRSILTGESLPVAALPESNETNYLETKCIGMQGTHCTSGSGVGVVVSTGDNTVFGHIAKLTSTPSTERTPLQKEILRFVLIIVTLMITMNIIVIGVWAGYIRKNYPGYMPVNLLIVNIVSVAIAFVPEGLPIALTASLTIVANVMRKNNILCKSLKTVETLGAVSVLLSDKTGTLTKNQMVVTNCLIGFSKLTTEEAQRAFSSPDAAGTSTKDALKQLSIVSAVCNAGDFDPVTLNKPFAERKIIGDATDQAVLRFSESLAPVSESRNLWRKRFDLAFNSKNKFALKVLSPTSKNSVSSTLSVSEAETFDPVKDLLLMIKGAPDVLITRCLKYVGEDGEVHVLDEGVRTSIEKAKDQWSSEGKRVLLLARKILPASTVKSDPNDGEFEAEAEQHAKTDLALIALVGIVDPPRDEIPDVVRQLRRAGIRTMMVTGDFKLTAQAIARSCGIITTDNPALIHSVADIPRSSSSESEKPGFAIRPESALVVSGPELAPLTIHQWDILTSFPYLVFARTTPDQKLRIVREFRSRGYVTGMTGDGVNDAPSLKEADIGIAPGSGSDIALAAADMVLLDSFSAIIPAVTYGRVVFDNLKKTIAYLLPAGSFSEFWPVMTSVLFGLPQVLSSFLMIIICCFTDCFAACALAYEKPEADVMMRPPRNLKTDRLVDWKLLTQSYGFIGIVETTTSFAMSFWYLQRQGIPFSKLWFSFGDFSSIDHDADYISHHLSVASAIYFVNLVVMQWFVLMALRTRHLSIFSHPPVGKKETRNWLLFPAILFALVIAFIFCYIPGLQNVATSAQVPVEHWFLPVAFGAGLLMIDEGRKAGARRWPEGWAGKCAW